MSVDILAIETSCDETACAVVRDGREVLSNVIYTQIGWLKPKRWPGLPGNRSSAFTI